MTYALVLDGKVADVARLPHDLERISDARKVLFWSGITDDELAECGWFPVVDAAPAYDAATEVLERGEVVVSGGAPTRDYTVRPKTSEELATEAEAAATDLEQRQARKAISDLAAFLALPSPTAAQTRDAVILLVKIVRRLIRDNYGDVIVDPTLPDLPAGNVR